MPFASGSGLPQNNIGVSGWRGDSARSASRAARKQVIRLVHLHNTKGPADAIGLMDNPCDHELDEGGRVTSMKDASPAHRWLDREFVPHAGHAKEMRPQLGRS